MIILARDWRECVGSSGFYAPDREMEGHGCIHIQHVAAL